MVIPLKAPMTVVLLFGHHTHVDLTTETDRSSTTGPSRSGPEPGSLIGCRFSFDTLKVVILSTRRCYVPSPLTHHITTGKVYIGLSYPMTCSL
ncbi:hypothetical protein PGT21_006578 [Puccinia graminis f. sp. tritici]|uniref:Uncharacterized protein n=1 Tax=Puccinia graminis f. sp. tritici TaxID=56615 RepID=A0A5B0MV90_PUCGR|nr:hypothetical protein PGTUg99_026850 [Puccinia graminis f. sp. tritici]KAA1103982.1 hypothetical protein PGT21_006578 [Puccinia graminis f. sp. tritici]